MSDDNEGIGYGKPPKKHQFKKGQSGNPKGRKKGSRGLKTDLQAELASMMTIQMNGTQVTATKQLLMMKTLSARAASGDIRAADKLVDLIIKIIDVEDRNADTSKLSAQDSALLEQLIGTHGDSLTTSGGSDGQPEIEAGDDAIGDDDCDSAGDGDGEQDTSDDS
ncbi:MAG: DUF5681 domain-containing protein [Marinomonas sp.]|uniref:DUF5681 domain-containing protein n=1 Tax=Parasphingorhabdus sp. TaxID=2709688 RepID=UPI00327DAD1D